MFESPISKLPDWAQHWYFIGAQTFIWLCLAAFVIWFIWFLYDEVGPVIFFSVLGFIVVTFLVFFWPFIFL